ncbi:response regulator [Aureimonas sp. ME7]|uniref:response regulator n=1 Tax=Aureimonas sp. ME7 TaxID=2744252 RepID=UPI0015FCBF45|nr:response regulator [Aureimonas sp. ME7]
MRHLRVLIVEDEPLIALDLQDILTDAGHTVVGTAGSMSEAMALAHDQRPFDLAIMDVDLADSFDGIETAQRLRQDFAVSSLFVSGPITAEQRALALRWNPIGFIPKPFLEEQIISALDAIPSSLECH